jgi:hypothetical protein
MPELADTSEACSPLKSASTACRRCSSGERPWDDGAIIEVTHPPQKGVQSHFAELSGDRHQFTAAHTGVEASQLDRTLLSDLEALISDWSVPSAERGCLLRSSGLTPDRVFGIVLHLTGGVQRAADDGGDHL